METKHKANPPEKITTLAELISARERRKAITCPSAPCFDADCFERRDIDELCDKGGDYCCWTMVALHASDGLRAKDKVNDPLCN